MIVQGLKLSVSPSKVHPSKVLALKEELNLKKIANTLPLVFSWVGIFSGIALGIFLVYYLDIQQNLDRFCILGMAVLGFQFLGVTIGGAWGRPSLQDHD